MVLPGGDQASRFNQSWGKLLNGYRADFESRPDVRINIYSFDQLARDWSDKVGVLRNGLNLMARGMYEYMQDHTSLTGLNEAKLGVFRKMSGEVAVLDELGMMDHLHSVDDQKPREPVLWFTQSGGLEKKFSQR